MRFRGLIGKTKGKFISQKRWLREREIIEKRIAKAGRKMREAIRARNQARSPKVKEKWQKVIRHYRPIQQRDLRERTELEQQGQPLPKGRRLEVSLRFRRTAGWLRSPEKNRLRMLKVVVTVNKKGVTKAQVERAVEDAMRSGRRTPGIQLQFADWGGARQSQGRLTASSGRLSGENLHEQLKPFAGLLRKDALTSSEVIDASEERPRRSGAKSAKRRRTR